MKKIFLISLLFTNCAFATNFYVSQGAPGTNSGTLANPWNSVASINQSLMNSGDSLLFERGKKYTSGQINITRSNVVWGAYGTGAKPLFWGNGATRPYLFYLNNLTNTIIRDIQIVDTTISTTDRTILAKLQRAVTFDGSSNGCNVINCYFDRVGLAVYFSGGSNKFYNNEVTNGRMIVNTNDGGVDDYGANAFVISTSGNEFIGNFIHDCYSFSWDFNWDGGNDLYCPSGTCGNNVIAYNTVYDSNGFLEFTGNSPGNLIIYNKLVQCESNMYFQSAGSYNYLNNVFANNVCVELTLGRLAEPRLIGSSGTLAAGSLLIYNNVFNLASGVDVTNNATGKTHENNIYKLSNGSVANYTLNANELSTNLTLWTSTTGDPLTWDYNPSAGSPLIGFGKNISSLITPLYPAYTDFAGRIVANPPNAGIMEQVGTTLRAASSFGTIACNGGTTTVTVTASGGTAPYTGTGTFTRSAGAYSYTVTDNVGATSVTTGVIPQPIILAATSSQGSIACNGGTTTVTVAASGGTAPYTGTGTFTRSAGAYSYTVTDARGCTAVTTGTVTQPSTMTATSSTGTIACNGGTTTVTVAASGGTAPYTGTGTFTRSAGAYSYTVTDARGCTAVTTGTVTQPVTLVASAVAGTIVSPAVTTTVTVTATGGTAPYTGTGVYSVGAGAYSYTVTDARGCTSTVSGTIAAPVPTPVRTFILKGIAPMILKPGS